MTLIEALIELRKRKDVYRCSRKWVKDVCELIDKIEEVEK